MRWKLHILILFVYLTKYIIPLYNCDLICSNLRHSKMTHDCRWIYSLPWWNVCFKRGSSVRPWVLWSLAKEVGSWILRSNHTNVIKHIFLQRCKYRCIPCFTSDEATTQMNFIQFFLICCTFLLNRAFNNYTVLFFLCCKFALLVVHDSFVMHRS